MSCRSVSTFAAVLAAALAVGACRRAPAADADASGTVAVTVTPVRLDTLRDAVTAPGTVMPSAAGDFTVYAPEAAEIVELPKKEQDPVAPGDILVRFEIPSYSQALASAQLDVLGATAKADRARAELVRQTSLMERGITARNTYDASKLDAAAADSALNQSKARLEALQAIEERTTVRSRFTGVVTRVWHAPGDAVRDGTDDPILRVVDPSHVQVSLQLPIAQVARVLPGQEATVQAVTGAAAEPARVVMKVAVTDPAAATAEIRLAFINPATLPVDTPVTASIVFDQRAGALIIPATAVGRDGLGSFVMIAGDDLKAHRRDVHLGLVTKDLAQVTGGLSAGERVIVTGAADVAEGTSIAFAQR